MENLTPKFNAIKPISIYRRWRSISVILIILSFFSGFGEGAKAQTVQLGSGSETSNYVPFYYLYNYGYSQSIYTSAELISSGMDPNEGLITKIRYKATSSQSTINWEDWEIYMGNTTKTGFSGGSDWVPSTGITEVFNGQIAGNVVAGQWLEITLTTPFQWDGTSNIVVAVNQTTGDYGNDPAWAAYTLAPSTGSKGIYIYEDGAAYDPINPPTGASVVNKVAQIQFDGNLQASCSGTPIVGAVTGPAGACLNTDLFLDGTPNSEAGITYQWQESPDGTIWSDISGATTVDYTVVGGITTDTYYRLVVTCTNSALSANSNDIFIPTLSGAVCICVPTGADNNSDEIVNFTLSNLNNTSAPSEGVDGYSDYSGTVAAAVLQQGVSFISTLTSGTGSGSHGAAIWIDYNDNGLFEATELVSTIDGIQSSQTVSFPSFMVPVSAPLGQHRLRVQYAYNLNGNTLTPCSVTTNYSEFEDYMVDVQAAPACLSPNALIFSNLTSNSVDLGWTENGTATLWNIEYGLAGFTLGNGTPVTATTTNPISISGLSENTAYDFYVQSDCGSGSLSDWSSPITINTPCIPYTIPYNEGFESGYVDAGIVAGCISQESEAGTQAWTANNTLTDYNRSPRTGGWNAFLKYGNADWIFIPVDLVGGTSYTTDVYARQDGSGLTNANLSINYGISADSTAMTNAIALETGLEDGNYQLVAGTFTPATSGVYYIGIRGFINSSPWYISIDDIAIYETPTCVAPSALVATNVLSTSADLGWTSSAAEFQLEYDVSGFTLGSGTLVTTTSNPEAISGLTGDTDYSFYVRSICSPGDTSTWAGPFSFYTGVCTPAPTSVDGIGITNVTMGTINNTTIEEPNNYGDYTAQVTDVAVGATLPIDISLNTGLGYGYNLWVWVDWNGDLDFDDANEEYYLGESAAAATTTFNGSIVIPTGVALGNYRIRIGGADSGLGSTSPSDPCYTGTYATFEDYTLNVIAAPTCPDPTVLSASNFTTSTADLAWTENGTATLWNIEYGPAGFTQGAGIAMSGVATNPFTLTGLNPCMNYDYYVQSDCGGGDLSAFVGPYSFTTLAVPATGTDTQVACDSYTWIDGLTYTTSNNSATFTIVGGGSSICGNDSIVTLDLTINTSVTGTDVQEACETFTWIDGNDYIANNNTATFTIAGGAANGCDSIVTLDLTINNSVTGTDVQVSCGTFTWIDGMDYTTDNNTATYTIVGGAANGCDSIVTLDLTIEQGSNAGNDNAETHCLNEPIDLATLLSSGADAGGTYYGPTNSPLPSSMITVSNQGGTYEYKYVTPAIGSCAADTAVFTITADAGCDYLSVDLEMLVDISVYPNPATSVLTILNPSNTASLKVEMLDMNGRTVLVENQALNNATQAILAIDNLERGVYTLRIYNNESQKTFKIVKQ